LREYWGGVLDHLQTRRELAGFVGANWRFWAERDLAAAAHARGIPFVVLHKECFKTRDQERWSLRAYGDSGSFEGTRILTYNQDEKNLLVEAGVVAESQVTVTGAPRFDALHEMRRARSSRPTGLSGRRKIVCFAVSPHAGLALDAESAGDGARRVLSWLALCEQSLEVWAATAARRQAVDFVVKVKVGSANVDPVRNWWSRASVPPNLTLEIGGVATDVLVDSAGACGFNTTALLDATASGVPIGMIRYGPAGEAHPDILQDYGGIAEPLTDLEATLAWVDHVVEGRDGATGHLDAVAEAMLEQAVGNADGRAGERVWKALMESATAPRSKGLGVVTSRSA
jgi:hypothetical protein